MRIVRDRRRADEPAAAVVTGRLWHRAAAVDLARLRRRALMAAAANCLCCAVIVAVGVRYDGFGRTADAFVGFAAIVLSVPLLPLTAVVVGCLVSGGTVARPAVAVPAIGVMMLANSVLWGYGAAMIADAVRSRRAGARAVRLRVGRACPTCGYDLRVTPDRCPECGDVPSWAAAQREIDDAVRRLEGQTPAGGVENGRETPANSANPTRAT